MTQHGAAEAAAGFEQIADAVRLDHPFRKKPRLSAVAPLAGTDEADQPQLVRAKAGATRLVMTDVSPGMLAKRAQKPEAGGESGLAIPPPELSRELVRHEAHPMAGPVPHGDRPAAERPDDQPLRRIQLGQ